MRPGTPVTVTLVSSSESGRLAGATTMEIALTALVVSGRAVPVTTAALESSSRSRGRSTGVATAAGALLGALAGALSKQDVATGAATGAAAGVAAQAMRGPQRVVFPAESVYSFVVREPVEVPLAPTSTGVCGPVPAAGTFTSGHDTGVFQLRYPRDWHATGDASREVTVAPGSGVRVDASGARSTVCGVVAGAVPVAQGTARASAHSRSS